MKTAPPGTLADLAETSSQSGELEDALTGLGHGSSRLFLEGFAAQLAECRHLTFGSNGVSSPQSVETSVSESVDEPLDGGPTHPVDFGGLLTRDSTVQ